MAGERILIVEDNPINMKLFRLVLTTAGYDVRAAGDAEEALTLVEEFRPQAILMDIQLPGIDGLELARRLKAEPRTRDMIIVALTAYAMKGDEDRARAAGFDGYITKPIDAETFAATVASHFESAR